MEQTIRHGGRADGRPTREQIEPAARMLVQRHSGQLVATARRYSLSAEDAEDAYQRGLEILLTKAPSVREDDLVPWLKTVVKHEAFAIRKQRQRAELVGAPELAGGLAPAPDEQAERHERLRLGVEAMSRLKPQERRCLLLRAEGYSYKQICDETGWTYTKVNRCVSEGRKAFLARLEGIESGAECESMAPLLSRLVDGEATAEDIALLRPHLQSCLACRAKLRDFRDTPARVAAFAPLLATPHVLWRALHRIGRLFGQLGAHKTAAVLVVGAALAGGGATAVRGIDHGHARPRPAPELSASNRPPVANVARGQREPLRARSRHRRHHSARHAHAAARPSTRATIPAHTTAAPRATTPPPAATQPAPTREPSRSPPEPEFGP
jgi:RNA polymerase sigma factor (sigma-70 family)